jgi:5-methylcytosine-specific restriction endonuclease McrA
MKQIVPGSIEWLMLARDGAFSNRPPVPWEPPPKRVPKKYLRDCPPARQKRSARAAYVHKPCPYCKRTMSYKLPGQQPTLDHVHPKSKGGKKVIVACWTCNGIKGDMLYDEWIAFMAANPEWWAR